MSQKLNVETFIEDLNKENYIPKFLPSDYKNNKTKLLVICPEGHEWYLKPNGWYSGYRCPICARARIANEQKIDIDAILGVEGYKRLSEYKNRITPFKVLCSNNHEFSITYNMWDRGSRCPVCLYNRDTRIVPEEFVKSEVEKEGYKFVSYDNGSKGNLTVICPNGHEWSTKYGRWHNGGARCKKCATINTANKNRHSFEFVKSVFESNGYKLLSTEYKTQLDVLEYLCPKGHKGTVRLNDWLYKGTRCDHCSHHISSGEQAVFDLLSPLFPDLIHSDREIIKPKELDIVIPSKKVAIEYCGLYWHSESNGKDKNYHLSKLQDCERVGYRLITIFEDEWLYKNDIVKSMLLNKLGVSDKPKIFARKCEVKEIIPSRKNGFLNRNHIQGQDTSAVNLGAFYDGRLVSVMTFSKGSISRNIHAREGVYELSRFCSDYDYNVIGIAGKLLKYFENTYKPVELYTYSDKRWSDGNLYRKLGFDFIHDSIPNYFYIVEGRRVHRFNFRKNVLKDKLKNFNPELTEKENMIANEYEFVYDCGNSKWVKLYS